MLGPLGFVFSIEVIDSASHSFKCAVSVKAIFKSLACCNFSLFGFSGQTLRFSCLLLFLLRSFLDFFTLRCCFLWRRFGSRSWFASFSFRINSSGFSLTFCLLIFLNSSCELLVPASDEALRLDIFILLRLVQFFHSPVVKVTEG